MINETFTFQRFWNYFKYDLKQLWHNNGKAAILLGGISVICYVIWVLGSLVFTGSWQAPGIAARLCFFAFGSLFLVFYQTRTYGYLTQKQPGQAWLMIPASALEKAISMMIITVILLPLAYIVSYLALDGIIALLDKTAGDAILVGWVPASQEISNALSAASEEGFQFNLSALALPVIFQFMGNLLYFLLCGICFRKWKIASGLAITMAASAVFTPIFSHFALNTWSPMLAEYGSGHGDDPTVILEFLNSVISWGTVVDFLIVVALAIGIYYRIKTLKH